MCGDSVHISFVLCIMVSKFTTYCCLHVKVRGKWRLRYHSLQPLAGPFENDSICALSHASDASFLFVSVASWVSLPTSHFIVWDCGFGLKILDLCVLEVDQKLSDNAWGSLLWLLTVSGHGLTFLCGNRISSKMSQSTSRQVSLTLSAALTKIFLQLFIPGKWACRQKIYLHNLITSSFFARLFDISWLQSLVILVGFSGCHRPSESLYGHFTIAAYYFRTSPPASHRLHE